MSSEKFHVTDVGAIHEAQRGRRNKRLRKTGPAISAVNEPTTPLPTEEIKISAEEVERVKERLDMLRQHILHSQKINQTTVAYFIRQLQIPEVKLAVRECLVQYPEIYDVPKERIDQLRLDSELTVKFGDILAELEKRKQ